MGFLVGWLCDNLMVDKRKDMFVMDGTVYVFFLAFFSPSLFLSLSVFLRFVSVLLRLT